jgi:hypothetical protein
MFNKPLNRPMFRRGGRAGGGIMTGVETPKRGQVDGPGSYAGDNEKIVESVTRDMDLTDKIAPRYANQGSDFFMGLGANILAAPGGNPIFQTLGQSAKEPLNLMMKQNMANTQGDREIASQLIKNYSEDDKNKLYAEATARFNNKGINPRTDKPYTSVQEAYSDLIQKDLMSKEKILTPEAQYNLKYEELFNNILNKDIAYKGNRIGAAALAKHETDVLMEKYPKDLQSNFDNDLSYFDNMLVDDNGDGTYEINEFGKPSGFRKGKVYFFVSEKKLYRLGEDGKTFTEIDIADFED